MPSTNDYVNNTLLEDSPVGSWPPILNFMWITFEKENGNVWKPDTISKNGPQSTAIYRDQETKVSNFWTIWATEKVKYKKW